MSSNRFVQVGPDMTWPSPFACGDLIHRLTFAPETITDQDKLVLASVCNAYRQLVTDGRAKREMVCRSLRNFQKSHESEE